MTLREQPSAPKSARKRHRRRHFKRPYSQFEQATVRRVKVSSDPRKQAAAFALIKQRGLCGYRGQDGLIGDIGIPRKPEYAKRIWKAKSR